MGDQQLTIGIEEEFQIVDAGGELKAHIDTLLAAARSSSLVDDVRAEMLQSVVEVGTRICADVSEARAEVLRLRGGLAGLLQPEGLRIASAGTHPFSHWQDQRVTEMERYKLFEDQMQDLVRELLIFGMHVHVGIADPEARIEVMNEARYFLPHLLALSTSSPFWLNRRTGLKSYRSVIWSRFPRSGIPPEFSSHADFDNYIELLIKTNTIDTGKSIWWDLRPHWQYPTIEFRICDAVTRVDEVICLAALVQAICAKLLKLRSQNLGFRKYPPQLIHENKFRAFRHGLDGRLIDFGKQREVPMRDLAVELVEFVDDVVDELGSRKDVEYVHTILREGTSADRQLAVHQASDGDMQAVVKHVTDETLDRCAAAGLVGDPLRPPRRYRERRAPAPRGQQEQAARSQHAGRHHGGWAGAGPRVGQVDVPPAVGRGLGVGVGGQDQDVAVLLVEVGEEGGMPGQVQVDLALERARPVGGHGHVRQDLLAGADVTDDKGQPGVRLQAVAGDVDVVADRAVHREGLGAVGGHRPEQQERGKAERQPNARHGDLQRPGRQAGRSLARTGASGNSVRLARTPA